MTAELVSDLWVTSGDTCSNSSRETSSGNITFPAEICSFDKINDFEGRFNHVNSNIHLQLSRCGVEESDVVCESHNCVQGYFRKHDPTESPHDGGSRHWAAGSASAALSSSSPDPRASFSCVPSVCLHLYIQKA